MFRIYKTALFAFLLSAAVAASYAFTFILVTRLAETQHRGLRATPYLVCAQQEFKQLLTPLPGQPTKVLPEPYRTIVIKLNHNLGEYVRIEKLQPIDQLTC